MIETIVVQPGYRWSILRQGCVVPVAEQLYRIRDVRDDVPLRLAVFRDHHPIDDELFLVFSERMPRW